VSEFGLVNSTVQTVWYNENKIIGALEQNGSRIKRFRKPERRDLNEVLLSWFKQKEVTKYQGAISFLPSFSFYRDFKFYFMYFFNVNLYGNLQF
jgi:hypothetical protein